MGILVATAAACGSGDRKGASSGSASNKSAVTAAPDDPLGQELADLAKLQEKLEGKSGDERTAGYEEAQKKCLATVGKRGVAVIGELAKRLERASKGSPQLQIAISRCLLDLKMSLEFSGQDKAFADAVLPSLGSDDPEVITNACLTFSAEQAKANRKPIESAKTRMEERAKKEPDAKRLDRFKNAAASCNLALM